MKHVKLAQRLAKWGLKKMKSRKPDFVIGSEDNPYLLRWWILPRNKFFNIYLHLFMRSDDDRALHDHPWWNASFVLDGGYYEYMPKWKYANPEKEIHTISMTPEQAWYSTAPGRNCAGWKFVGYDYQDSYPVRRWHGDFVFRKATASHRVELFELMGKPVYAMTLFFTGPRIRTWGFQCPKAWVNWKDFVSVRPGGNDIGKGCDQ